MIESVPKLNGVVLSCEFDLAFTHAATVRVSGKIGQITCGFVYDRTGMAPYLTPHSSEWFSALDVFDPAQAAHTRQILKAAGRSDVCSVCGDHPAEDFQMVGENVHPVAVASIRLCDDCRNMRQAMNGEKYEPLHG